MLCYVMCEKKKKKMLITKKQNNADYTGYTYILNHKHLNSLGSEGVLGPWRIFDMPLHLCFFQYLKKYQKKYTLCKVTKLTQQNTLCYCI